MAKNDLTFRDMASILVRLEDQSLISPVASPSVLPVEKGSGAGLLGVSQGEDFGLSKDEIPIKASGPLTRLPDIVRSTGDLPTNGPSVINPGVLEEIEPELGFGDFLEETPGIFSGGSSPEENLVAPIETTEISTSPDVMQALEINAAFEALSENISPENVESPKIEPQSLGEPNWDNNIPTFDAATLSDIAPQQNSEISESKANIEGWLGRDATPEELAMMLPSEIGQQINEYYSLEGINNAPPPPPAESEKAERREEGLDTSRTENPTNPVSEGSVGGTTIEGPAAREIAERTGSASFSGVNSQLLDKMGSELENKLGPLQEDVLRRAADRSQQIFDNGLETFTRGA